MPLNYRNRAKMDQQTREAFDDIVNHIENVMRQTNSSSTGETTPPPTPGGLNVTAAQGIFDASIQDNQSSVARGVQYFLEYSDSPTFSAPKTISLGPSRNWRGHLGSGTYYWRGHSAYPTSARSSHVYHGTETQPVAVRGGGAISGPVGLPSNGSGTSQGPSGSDGAFGNQSFRGGRPVTI